MITRTEEVENFKAKAMDDALDCIDEHSEAIAESLLENNCEADDDPETYDQYVRHENWQQHDYGLIEAAHLLDQLEEHEESDTGLWEGADGVREILSSMAAFTYCNACTDLFRRFIKDLNNDSVLEELNAEYQENVEKWSEEDTALQKKKVNERIELLVKRWRPKK